MSATATLGGIAVTAGSIVIPHYGLWSADLTLATDEAVPDDTTCVIGNLSMKCHVYRTNSFVGARMCRVVGGAGGWRKDVASYQYDYADGVRLSMILGDVAREVGESINVPSDRVVGTGYAREAAKASRTLRLLVGDAWYMDPAGVTQIGARPSPAVSTQFDVVDQDSAAGIVTIATEDYLGWLPGCTFTGPTLDGSFTNQGVTYRMKEGVFRLQVMT